MTFGQLVTGTGGTAAGSITQIGSDISMPAGGDWLIHHLWGMVVQDTAVASEAVAGQMQIDSVGGDISPDPAPGKYPLIGKASSAGANFSIHSAPLNIYPVNWVASGKAEFALKFINDAGNATAPLVAMGIIFGDKRPEIKPLTFSDAVSATLTANTETTIGQIQLSERATRIVGIMATATKDGAITADEGMLATIRLDSADVKIQPAKYPCTNGFNAADGTPAGGTALAMPTFMPVDIEIPKGARIDCFGTLINAVTAGLDIQVFLAYE